MNTISYIEKVLTPHLQANTRVVAQHDHGGVVVTFATMHNQRRYLLTHAELEQATPETLKNQFRGHLT